MEAARPYEGPIVDAHQHFWDPTHNYHPWLAPGVVIPFRYGDYSAIKRPYLPPDYRRDIGRYDVRMTVYVETEWDPTDPIGETKYATKLAAEHGWPNAIVAQAWLDREDVEDVLAGQAAFPLVRSVRHKPGGPRSLAERADGQRTLMMDDRWRAGYALLAEHGLNFDLQTPWWNLDDARDLAADFPMIQIIINHAGLPADRSPDGLAGWRAAIERLAALPNVAMKVSGIGDRGHQWTPEHNRWIVREAINAFGVDRIMFASNFPVDRLCASFDDIFGGFAFLTADLPLEDQRKLFHDNAARLYRLCEPADGGSLAAAASETPRA
jgi:predicted TIM-barrel fold metal-dependent hydrolase